MLGDATGAELLYLPADIAKDGAVVQRAYDYAARLRSASISEFCTMPAYFIIDGR